MRFDTLADRLIYAAAPNILRGDSHRTSKWHWMPLSGGSTFVQPLFDPCLETTGTRKNRQSRYGHCSV